MYTSNRRGRSSSPRPKRSGQSSFRHKKTFVNKTRPSGRGRFARHSGSSGGKQRGPRKLATFDVSRYINKNPARTKPEVAYVPSHSFADFGLSGGLRSSIASLGLKAPTQIQDGIIPHILAGRDVIGLANTGTGKTAAFLIPLIELTLQNSKRETLILAPTRELAIQIEQELQGLTQGMRLYSATCVGGVGIYPQIQKLRRKQHFIIGTPGRVLDLINRGSLKRGTLSTVVLDEADRMLDMGFIHDIRKILSGIPKDRETLFFSATMLPSIEVLIKEFSRNPVTVSVRKQDITNNIEQDVVRYNSNQEKFTVLADLLKQDGFTRVLVFGAMKHSVERLSKQLGARGISADSIHGNKSHPQRQRSLKRFKESQARVLVATDVAARGIHVDNISHVINYDLPTTYEDYIHRIGRTGRGANRGKALTFVH